MEFKEIELENMESIHRAQAFGSCGQLGTYGFHEVRLIS